MIQLKPLYEAIEDVKKYYPKCVNDGVFEELIALDPTYREGSKSLGKYGKWILGLWEKEKITRDDFDEITPTLDLWTAYSNRFDNKDLQQFKTLDDLVQGIARVADDTSRLSVNQLMKFNKRLKKGKIHTAAEDDYEEVFDDDMFKVTSPNTRDASIKLGNGAVWCTAQTGDRSAGFYQRYTQGDHRLWIITDKTTGKRYQFADYNGELRDERNNTFNWFEIFSKDQKFYKWLNRNFPDKFPWIELDADGYLRVSSIRSIPSEFRSISKVKVISQDGVIQKSAFYASSVTDIIIDDGITQIGEGAFLDCTRLKSVKIPDTVVVIGDRAFEGCERLKDIVIPDSVTTIGDRAFDQTGITEMLNTNILSDGMYRNTAIKTATIPEGTTNIPANLFSGCEALKSVSIPDTVQTIGAGAFSGCKSLKKVNIPEGVTGIGRYAFEGTAIQDVKLPSTLTTLDIDIFRECSKLKSVELPDAVTGVPTSMFAQCTSLESVKLGNNISYIHNDAFHGCLALKDITIPDSVTEITYSAFGLCRSLESVKIPDGVTAIPNDAFARCIKLSDVTIGSHVESIGCRAFRNCVRIKSITIPASVTKIDAYAFEGCSNLNSITIEGTDVNITPTSFDGCGQHLVVYTRSKKVRELLRQMKIKTAGIRNESIDKLNIQEW